MKYPPIKTSNTIQEQAFKILEEAGEFLEAITEGTIPQEIEEFCDLEHAMETLLALMTAKHGERALSFGRDFVVGKNRRRGYYDESSKSTQ